MKRMLTDTRKFIIINAPVWQVLTIGCCIGLYIFPRFYSLPVWLNIACCIIIWQCLSAAIMLLLDYKRKRKVFTRILGSTHDIKKIRTMLKPLRKTICGLFVAVAVLVEYRSINKGVTH